MCDGRTLLTFASETCLPGHTSEGGIVAIAFHTVSTPSSETRQQYEDTWKLLDERGARHPAGRRSHTAWLVGDQLHVTDVWDSEEQFEVFFQTLGPILNEVGMTLAGPPQLGEAIQVVIPD